jgi:hypothetical protein
MIPRLRSKIQLDPPGLLVLAEDQVRAYGQVTARGRLGERELNSAEDEIIRGSPIAPDNADGTHADIR